MDWTPVLSGVITASVSFTLGVALNHAILKQRPKVSLDGDLDRSVARTKEGLTLPVWLQNDGDAMGYVTRASTASAVLEDGTRLRFAVELERQRRGGREGLHIDPHEGPIRFAVKLAQEGSDLDLTERHGTVEVVLQPSGRRWWGARHKRLRLVRTF